MCYWFGNHFFFFDLKISCLTNRLQSVSNLDFNEVFQNLLISIKCTTHKNGNKKNFEDDWN